MPRARYPSTYGPRYPTERGAPKSYHKSSVLAGHDARGNSQIADTFVIFRKAVLLACCHPSRSARISQVVSCCATQLARSNGGERPKENGVATTSPLVSFRPSPNTPAHETKASFTLLLRRTHNTQHPCTLLHHTLGVLYTTSIKGCTMAVCNVPIGSTSVHKTTLPSAYLYLSPLILLDKHSPCRPLMRTI